MTIDFGVGQCLFGRALVAWNERGINFLGFCNEVDARATEAEFRRRWPNAHYRSDPAGAQSWLDRVFENAHANPLPVWLRGSPFQLKVWEALLAIPEGANVSYGQIARAIGKPGASRAVGNVVGDNPVAWLIPCHRVIRKVGAVGGYRWGATTKRAMLGYESATQEVTCRP